METLGLDLGTSGVRAAVLTGDGLVRSRGVPLSADERCDPAALWAAVDAVLGALDLSRVRAIAVDGTSGTILPVGRDGSAAGPLSLYDETAESDIMAAIDRAAPEASAARGGASPLARAIRLQDTPGAARILHEADWVAGRLCGRFDTTDENNALKTGYDPVAGAWPAWIAAAGMRPGSLPAVLQAGARLGTVTRAAAARFGLRRDAVVAAGTTDGCASFLATGASEPGHGVTALGSTLTLKLLSDAPVFAPAHGVYSHHLLGRWLAGGASNAGGAVLARYFSPAQLRVLSTRIDPERDSGLDYYPLPRAGERFPVNDPSLEPRMSPRPNDDAAFLHGLLEGIARIEAAGYARLAEHGAAPVTRVLTLGGGAANPAWTRIRARVLGIPVATAPDGSAAHGAALLARRGLTARDERFSGSACGGP